MSDSNEDVIPAVAPEPIRPRVIDADQPRGDFEDPAIRAKYTQPGGKYYHLFNRPGRRERTPAEIERLLRELRTEAGGGR